MKIVAMVGSPSQNSINKKTVEFMKDRYASQLDIEILDIASLPFHNYDTEDQPPAAIVEMRGKIREADGLIFASPEYNQSIPAVLKNAIDWFSRVERVLIGKPAMILGCSPGKFGTIRSQEHLKDILTSQMVGVLPTPRNELFIGNYYDLVDGDGKLVDQETLEFLDSAVDQFIDWTNKINNK